MGSGVSLGIDGRKPQKQECPPSAPRPKSRSRTSRTRTRTSPVARAQFPMIMQGHPGPVKEWLGA